MYLHMPPSWLEVQLHTFLCIASNNTLARASHVANPNISEAGKVGRGKNEYVIQVVTYFWFCSVSNLCCSHSAL